MYFTGKLGKVYTGKVAMESPIARYVMFRGLVWGGKDVTIVLKAKKITYMNVR